MEARDLGNTITLYLPLGDGEAEPFVVLHEHARVGRFATRDDAVRFSSELAATLHARGGAPVRIRIEQDDGTWDTKHAFLAATGAPMG